MIYFIIYIIGYIIAYYICRYEEREINSSYSWEDVKQNLMFSLLSYILILIWIIVTIKDSIKLPKNPPKWL